MRKMKGKSRLFLTNRIAGFWGFGLTGYIVLGMSMIALGLGIALKIQSARLDSVKQEYAGFVSTVAEKGRQAEIKARAEDKLNRERKVKSDEELRKLRVANQSLNKRVRDNSSRSLLPETGPAAGEPRLACFDRGILDQSLRTFTGGIAELVISGQQATDALNNAKRWAQGN